MPLRRRVGEAGAAACAKEAGGGGVREIRGVNDRVRKPVRIHIRPFGAYHINNQKARKKIKGNRHELFGMRIPGT